MRAFALGTAAAAALLAAGTASAQPGRDVDSPPALQKRPKKPNEKPDPAGTREVRLDLNIEYVDGTIYNPTTGVEDKVRLRSYTDPNGTPPDRFVAPSIVARPGDTLRVNLHNNLPQTSTSYDAGCTGGSAHEMNVPHCFNGTNLHVHGLNVNPGGNGDNVLLSINPGVSFEYEYAIAPDHPAGTFWYHTHRHGSTALQVSSGMAGALIIKGDRLPTPTANGDLDTLLDGMKNFRERTLIFQQIQYGCFDADQNIKIKQDSTGRIVAWPCDPGDTGVIETYQDNRPGPAGPNGFGFGTWGQSNRYTSINGVILPTIVMKQNAVERWRMIHGGVRDTIRLIFTQAVTQPDLKPGRNFDAANQDAWINTTCGQATLPYTVVAADGLTLDQAQTARSFTMQPGYRYDALIQFAQEGDYCVIDALSGANDSVGGVATGARLLGIVRVLKDPASANRGTLTEQLVESAKKNMPADVRDAVVADLNNGLRLDRFTPHKTIDASEVTGTQELTFDIQGNSPPFMFGVANQLPTAADYDPRPYNPARVDRRLTLGSVDEWKLTSNAASHPFHIHVNPFQIVKIVNNNNPDFDVSAPGVVDQGDPQYRGLRGVWKDTIWVKPGYTVTMRTRYERYIGEFVLHCHILDHEDQGMMQNVAVVLPGGLPASVNATAEEHSNH